MQGTQLQKDVFLFSPEKKRKGQLVPTNREDRKGGGGHLDDDLPETAQGKLAEKGNIPFQTENFVLVREVRGRIPFPDSQA